MSNSKNNQQEFEQPNEADLEEYFKSLIKESDENVLRGFMRFPDPPESSKEEQEEAPPSEENAVEEAKPGEESAEAIAENQATASSRDEPEQQHHEEEEQAASASQNQPRVPKGFKPEPIGDLPEDVFNSLPDAAKEALSQLKARNAELLHQYKSREGRISALDRTVSDLRRKLAEYEFALKQNQQHPAERPENKNNQISAVQQKIADGISIEELEQDEDFKSLTEVDPVMARLLKKQAELLLRKAEESILSRIEPKISKVDEIEHLRHLEAESQKLLRYVPNVYEVISYKDPETGFSPWQAWVESVPEPIRRLATSDKADDVIYALRLYKQDMEAAYGLTNGSALEQPAAQTTTTTQDSLTAHRVAEARKRKLEAAATGAPVSRNPRPAVRSAAIGDDGPLSPEEQDELFKDLVRKFDEEILRNRR